MGTLARRAAVGIGLGLGWLCSASTEIWRLMDGGWGGFKARAIKGTASSDLAHQGVAQLTKHD